MIIRFMNYTAGLLMVTACLSGCSSKNTVFPDPDADIKAEIEKNKLSGIGSNNFSVKKVMPYQQKVSLMVGSRSNDSKVIVNSGKVLKILINSYKRKDTTLISSHDIYTYVEKPGFIVGENVPQRATDSVTTPLSNLPFKINAHELNVDTKETELSNEQVKNFTNNLYQKKYGYGGKNTKKISKIEKQRDETLMNYIKQKKGEKK